MLYDIYLGIRAVFFIYTYISQFDVALWTIFLNGGFSFYSKKLILENKVHHNENFQNQLILAEFRDDSSD